MSKQASTNMVIIDKYLSEYRKLYRQWLADIHVADYKFTIAENSAWGTSVIELSVDYWVDDNDESGKRIQLTTESFLEPGLGLDAFRREVFALYLYTLAHEAAERFLVDGERIYDPHKHSGEAFKGILPACAVAMANILIDGDPISYLETSTLPGEPFGMAPQDRAKLRPPNYLSLPPGTQWEIDKSLGLLDWDGAPVEYNRSGKPMGNPGRAGHQRYTEDVPPSDEEKYRDLAWEPYNGPAKPSEHRLYPVEQAIYEYPWWNEAQKIRVLTPVIVYRLNNGSYAMDGNTFGALKADMIEAGELTA
jgi:hypothetical protein